MELRFGGSLIHFLQEDSGQDLIEYALVAALIGLGAVVSMKGLEQAGTFQAAVAGIAFDLSTAGNPKGKLQVLMERWWFALPTASAVLSLLYPDESPFMTSWSAASCNIHAGHGSRSRTGYGPSTRPTSRK